jgi:putative peptidoglycan lipid II flippase
MIKKGSYITIIFIISTFIQLVSQIVVTRTFGAKIELDTFLAAVVLPTILVTIIFGTLTDAFLPLFGEKKVENAEKAESYFFTHLIVFSFISFILTILLNFFAKPIAEAFYSNRGEEFVQNVAIQMQYLFYGVPLAVIATFLGTYFYAHKHFLRFPVAQAIGSVANLGLILLLAKPLGIWAMVVAFVVNILFQIFFVLPKSMLKLRVVPINILPLLFAWIPLLISTFAIRTDTLLIRSFGAGLPTGYLVYLNLISKIFSLATSVMTIGIQVLLLPHLVEYFANKDFKKAIETVNKAKIVAVSISIVVTVITALLTPVAIRILFLGQKFTIQDVNTTISLIPFFVLPAIGWGVTSVFYQPLLALKKQLPLGMVNIAAVALGWGVGWLMNHSFGALPAVVAGVTVLLFTSIIGSEALWQIYKKRLQITKEQ